jgi:hypothetical protein
VRFEDDDAETKKCYVRSLADYLMMLDETGEIWKVAYSVTILQMFTSVMVVTSVLSQKVEVHVSFPNIITFIAASLSIASSIHTSTMEMSRNNACIQLIIKERPDDDFIKKKDFLATIYYVGQFVFMLATIVSVAQQSNPVGIVTNCTGLLLIQDLDRAVFSCLQLEAKASHEMKQKLLIVIKDPKFSSRAIFHWTTGLIMAGMIIVVATTS